LDSYKHHRRPRRARLSHRSLDWQPNDHLGRSWSRPHLFEHRRQILRGCTESDTDAYFDSNGSRDSHCNTDSDSNGDGDGYSDCDGDADRHTQGHTDAEAYTDTEAAPDSATTTLALK